MVEEILKGKVKLVIGIMLCICLGFMVSYLIIMNNLIFDEESVQSDVIIVTEGLSLVRTNRAS